MKLVDANVLLYAVNADSRHHDASRDWLDGALSGGDRVGFTTLVLTAYVRLTTKPGVLPRPLTVSQALGSVRAWLATDFSVLLHPGPRHLDLMTEILEEVGTGGNLVNDAVLGAIAREHRGTVVSWDNDFARLPGVRWARPVDLPLRSDEGALAESVDGEAATEG